MEFSRGLNFDRIRLYPGDQIVVPYISFRQELFVRGLRKWTQITSQLAITGGGLGY